MKNLTVLIIAIAVGVLGGAVTSEASGDPVIGLIVALVAFNATVGYRVHTNEQKEASA